MASVVDRIDKILSIKKSTRPSRTPKAKDSLEKSTDNKGKSPKALQGIVSNHSPSGKRSKDVQHLTSNSNQSTEDISQADIENSPVRVCKAPVYFPTPDHHSDLRKACRRIFTPSSGKRKSDDEDDSSQCSPVKTPRPVEKDVTPKSSKRCQNGETIVSTATPRRLFSSPERKAIDSIPSPASSVKSVSPLKSPRHKMELSQPNTKSYQATKRSLHTAKPKELIGRDKEDHEVNEFITLNLSQKTSSSLYISGAPGTGKTAVISHVIDRLKLRHKTLQSSFINCMMLRDSNSVFCKLHEELTGHPLKSKDSIKAIEKLITTNNDCILLVLDEIDQLDSKHHEILYRIFEWPALKDAKIILIGIANALDLTDRILPRLQSSKKCKPALMNFSPYSSTQITDILKHRLDQDSVIEASAVSFCAKKVAAVAGDMRKALDVCRRAVEMVEAGVRTQQVLRPTDCNSPKKNQPAALKKVDVTHISKVMSDVYGSSVTTAGSSDDSMPLQQKLAVCSLLLLVKTGKLKEVTLGKLHESYARICKRQHSQSIDQGEFHSVLCLLEARGVVTLKKAKDTRAMKVSLKLDEQELELTLKDKTLMSAILNFGNSN